MRALYPEPADLEPAALYRVAPPPDRDETRPWVVVNMISTVDGAVSVDGRSGGLGGAGDKAVFRALRAAADVVLVGAGTVRAERYRPPTDPDLQVAVVSARVELDWTWPLFTEGRAVVVTTTTAHAPVPAAVPTIRAGTDRVDLVAALAELGRRGARVVLCEGGPRLTGDMITAGLVDEVCVTVAPLLAAGDAGRLATSAHPSLTALRLVHVATDDDDYLYLRYVRAEGS